MIDCFCHTNLDNYNSETWPKEVSCKPLVGESMQSIDKKSVLKIVSITHCHNTNTGGPFLRIELNR